MNLKSKLRVSKSLATIISLVCIAMLGFIFQGCEKEELTPFQYSEFLDVDLSIENHTPEQVAVLEKAKDRIDKYVTIQHGKFVVSVNSGKEIGISEELYYHFLDKMEYTNFMISENNYAIEDNKLILNVEPTLNIRRLKSGSLEFNFGDNGWEVQVDLYWYGADISISDYYVKLIIGGTAVTLYWIPEPLVTKVVGTIAAIQLTAYEIWGGNGVTVHLRPWGNSYSYN